MNQDPTEIPVPGPVGFGPVPVDLAGTRPVLHFFGIIGFLCFALMHCVPRTLFYGKIKFVPQLFTFFIKNYFTMLKFSKKSF